MKTEWITIGYECIGKPNGHLPGRDFHDVEVTIGQRADKIRVEVLETWGSTQGRDEEHGRKHVVSIDTDLDAAVRMANARAKEAGICIDYMIQALSLAHSHALDTLFVD